MLLFSDFDCTAVGIFTTNKCKAAPVKYCMSVLPSNNIKAIITNSGQANAATGALGDENNQKIITALASELKCSESEVLIASTGVIGQQLSIDKITKAIPKLVSSVSNIAEKFALSILTTDLLPKSTHTELKLSGGNVTLTGICKGSGMINPNMATMLGYFLSDVKIDKELAQKLVKETSDKSFHMISVDGDMSTNDCVFMLANGASNVEIQNDADFKIFKNAMEDMSIVLAKSIARDGEGATKLIEAQATGLDDLNVAKDIARKIVSSSLVKTAIYGESPNWGRILAKIGEADISEDALASCEIYIQGFKVFANELPTDINTDNLKKAMKEDTISIIAKFSQGEYIATAWGCDLTQQYVSINADYLS